MVNELSNGVANVAGIIALVSAMAVVCAEISPIAGGISLAASAVEVLTSDQTTSCLSGHSLCPEAIVSAAIVGSTGKFGLGGKAARALEEDATYLFRPGTFATESIPAKSSAQTFTKKSGRRLTTSGTEMVATVVARRIQEPCLGTSYRTTSPFRP
jgi:hypothetical protein